MKTLLLTLTTFFFISNQCLSQEDSLRISRTTPSWAWNAFQKTELKKNYTIIDSINPYYLESDFNGDEINDIALLVQNRHDKKIGILIINGGKNVCFIMGAGKQIGLGSDISWCEQWFIYRKKSAFNLDAKVKKLILRNPSIEIRKNEDESIIIYWDRKRYSSYVQKI
ncbi:MAG: hypothetical protein MK066_06775 [Crocinitomicaceae bacterium]|nr:hypothetical protein [Crocinitomicaceae bacterium]